MAAILATPAISLALGAPPTVLAIQLVVLACVTLFILTARPRRVTPRRSRPPPTGG
jgi:hypothetical protein